MSVYRYKAMPDGGSVTRGEVIADTSAAARAALRSAGLRVLDIRPLHGRADWSVPPVLQAAVRAAHHHIRRRRTRAKADLFDSLSTMLDSGIPLMDAVSSAATGAPSSTRAMLLALADMLKDGSSLSEAMRSRPGWFDPTEVAMITAGQHRGELPSVLSGLAGRHERSGELMAKLIGTLTYPFVVSLVGLGVVVFLSTKTLPVLVGLLDQAGVEPPRLTALVMGFGQGVAAWWWLMVPGVIAIALIAATVHAAARRRGIDLSARMDRFAPRVVRKLLVARMSGELAEMTKAGVPAAEALRIIAPTFGPPVGGGLRRQIEEAVLRIERGDSIGDALSDPRWFDAQFVALVAAGQASGELDVMLSRLANRESRRAHRLLDRLTSLLEPAVVLMLAVMVGTVAMAAILPLIRLQETL